MLARAQQWPLPLALPHQLQKGAEGDESSAHPHLREGRTGPFDPGKGWQDAASGGEDCPQLSLVWTRACAPGQEAGALGLAERREPSVGWKRVTRVTSR